jgi:hypothetical protein
MAAREPPGESPMHRSIVKNHRLVALFLLGVLLFNYPLLALFSRTTLVFGIPLLYVYVFGAWTFFIALLAYVIERSR